MSTLGSDIRNDIKAAQKIRLPWWGVLAVTIVSLPMFWLFDNLGKLYLALPLLNCIAVFGFIVAVKWGLRTHTWFWLTLAVFALLHLPLLLYIPWTTAWVPAFAIALIDSLDFCVILSALSVIGRLLKQT